MRSAVVAVAAGLLLAAACSDDVPDESATTTTEAPGPIVDPEPATEVLLGEEIDRGAPRVISTARPDGRLQPVVVDGEPALFGPGGALSVLRGDEMALVDAQGLEASEAESRRLDRILWVEGMTSTDEGLVAWGADYGHHGLPGEPYASPLLWSSEDDGRSWEVRSVYAIPSGTDGVFLAAMTPLDDGSLLAAGTVLEGDEHVQHLWRAENLSSTWQEVDAPGLDRPDEFGASDRILDLAAVGDVVLATSYVQQDGAQDLVLSRGTVGGEFEEVEATGLEDLDVEGEDDILAQLVAVDDTFLLYGSLPREGADPAGKRQLAFFTSPDGETWQAQPLDDTIVRARFPLGVAVDDDELITATATGRAIMIRRYPRD